MKPIAITVGEPAGIGPDILLQWIDVTQAGDFVVIADESMLKERARLLNLKINFVPYYQYQKKIVTSSKNEVPVLHVPLEKQISPGKPESANAKALLQTLQLAVAGCQSNEFSAMVTGPIHKATINEAGIKFSGHTEYLAELTNTKRVVMMLVADTLRVALVTTHLPLAKVPAAITPKVLTETLQIVESAFQKFTLITRPRLFVCGLNPHAGEGGYLGREEIEIITPVIQALKEKGMDVKGPFPADTIFTPKILQQADVIIAMYHDQGLPVLKHAGFGHAVNITLGLPFVRTSVDHGTAFDLAGTGKADWGSFAKAVEVAKDWSQMDLFND